MLSIYGVIVGVGKWKNTRYLQANIKYIWTKFFSPSSYSIRDKDVYTDRQLKKGIAWHVYQGTAVDTDCICQEYNIYMICIFVYLIHGFLFSRFFFIYQQYIGILLLSMVALEIYVHTDTRGK